MTDDEIIAAVEAGLGRAGPRPDGDRAARASRARIQPSTAISTCCAAYRRAARPRRRQDRRRLSSTTTSTACPRRSASLNLFDPRTGMPRAILDATVITDMRTGAMTAIGAKHLARKNSKVLGHIGARGTAYWNVRLLDHLFDFDEIRVHSRRPESRDAFAARLSRRSRQDGHGDRRLAEPASRAPTSSSRPRGCRSPQPLLKTEWIKPGALRRALRHDERGGAVADRHHGQDGRRRLGPVQGRHVRRAARPRRDRQAQRADAACRARPDRRRPASPAARATTRPSCSGIAACRSPTSRSAHAMLEKATRLGIGQKLRFA